MAEKSIRELIMVAESLGYLHTEIARACNVSNQSTVSRWKASNKCRQKYKRILQEMIGDCLPMEDKNPISENSILIRFSQLANDAILFGYELSIKKVKH